MTRNTLLRVSPLPNGDCPSTALLAVRDPDQLPQHVTPSLQFFDAKASFIRPFPFVVFDCPYRKSRSL